MKNFLGKNILFITAHPDDETFSSAGTIYKNYKLGGKTEIICATLGENGKSHLKEPLTKKQLKELRKGELLAVAKFLKVPKVYFLDLPDGRVKENSKKFYEGAEGLLAKIKPEVIISFGPDGISGHHDHIASYEVSLRLAQKYKLPMFAITRPWNPLFATMLRKRRAFGVYADKLKPLKPTLKIAVDPKIKSKAVSFHKSQIGPAGLYGGMPTKVSNLFTRYEYFAKVL